MLTIDYKFANEHTEKIEVSEEVAAAFEELEKYEKKVERRETRRHISLDMLKEKGKGFEFIDPNGDIFDDIDKRESEAREQLAEKARRAKLTKRKRQLERLLTPPPPSGGHVFQVQISENQKGRDCKVYGDNGRCR